ncbi:MAG: glycosyltransferase family 2 protein [Clostridiales bacterium]|nr:glycosyltransferase family 2 protein [Clostridiales bacterium]
MENISFIVLYHNNERFNIVIDALLKQRQDGDEIIIVNDHSDENHIKLLSKYDKEKDITVINSDVVANRSHNRNIGANRAKHAFLLFIDGDIVLLDNCVNLIKLALISGYDGAFGNIIQGGNTPEQMNLLVGFDYLKFLESNPKLEDFFKLNIAHDRRMGLIPENIVYRTEWQFYYSGYCAVTKKAFEACGKFNETFVGWGAEDVEFGYRLEKYGKIKYLNGAYAYHISHQRDLFAIMQNNKKNLYLFFSQQPTNEVEIYMAFHLSANILDSMKYIRDKVVELNLCVEHNLQSVGELSVLPVSNKYPFGCIAYIDDNSNVNEMQLMGIALPFNDNQFDYANLSTDIFCYPEIVAVKIVQECFRVSKCVRIYKKQKREHIFWNSAVINALSTRMSGMDRTNYHARVINDFMFSDNGEYYTIVGGIVPKMPYVHIDNLPIIYHEKNTEKECLLFDFTKDGLMDSEINQIADQYSLKIKGVYRIRLCNQTGKIKLSEIILGEMQLLSTPFTYVLDNDTVVDTNDIWWKYKTRGCDKIIYHL